MTQHRWTGGVGTADDSFIVVQKVVMELTCDQLISLSSIVVAVVLLWTLPGALVLLGGCSAIVVSLFYKSLRNKGTFWSYKSIVYKLPYLRITGKTCKPSVF